MMTSYQSSLLIASSSQTVLQDDVPDLSDLVCLGLRSPGIRDEEVVERRSSGATPSEAVVIAAGGTGPGAIRPA